MKKSKVLYALSEADFLIVSELARRLNCNKSSLLYRLHYLVKDVLGVNGLEDLLKKYSRHNPIDSSERQISFNLPFLKDTSVFYRNMYYGLAEVLNKHSFVELYNAYMLNGKKKELKIYLKGLLDAKKL